jgi:DNA end-binding protein Ku
MRTIWKGPISFGALSIPVRLHAATEERVARFHQLHKTDDGEITIGRVCSLCGQAVPPEEVVRGYEYEKGRFVAISDDELREVPTRSARGIDIIEFVDAEAVDPFFFQRPYYLEPDEDGLRGYALLREAMEDQDKIAIGKLALHGKEHLVGIRGVDSMLILETMNWPEEIVSASFPILEKDAGLTEDEIDVASKIVDTLSSAWEPLQLHDEYRDALRDFISEKTAERHIAGDGRAKEAAEESASHPATGVDAFMSTLRSSLEMAQVRANAAEALGVSIGALSSRLDVPEPVLHTATGSREAQHEPGADEGAAKAGLEKADAVGGDAAGATKRPTAGPRRGALHISGRDREARALAEEAAGAQTDGSGVGSLPGIRVRAARASGKGRWRGAQR